MDVDAAFDTLEAAARDAARGGEAALPPALTLEKLRRLRGTLCAQPDAVWYFPGDRATLLDVANAMDTFATSSASMNQQRLWPSAVVLTAHAVAVAPEARTTRALLAPAMVRALSTVTATSFAGVTFWEREYTAARDALLPIFVRVLLPADKALTEEGGLVARSLLMLATEPGGKPCSCCLPNARAAAACGWHHGCAGVLGQPRGICEAAMVRDYD